MKHHRTISRCPAMATSTLASKLEFKMSISDATASFVPTFTHNVSNALTGLFQNALALGTYITITIEEFTGGTGG